MHDWNRDGRIDNTDRTIDFMAYNSAMNESNTPKRTAPKVQTTGSTAATVWLIIAAIILIALICR